MHYDLAHRLAQLMTTYCVPVKKGDFVVIQGNTESIPLVKELVMAVIERGGHFHTHISIGHLNEFLLENGCDEQLEFISPVQELMYDRADIIYSIEAPIHTRALANIKPERLTIAQKAQQPLFQRFMERIGEGSLRWNLSAYPTNAAAQEANQGFLAYEDFLYKAYALHLDNPLSYWHEMRDKQTRLAEWLADKSFMEVKGEGIELSFRFENRPWISCHGDNNFPDGEIFTSPIEDSVNGHVEFNYPSVYAGKRVNGIKLTFKDGRAVEAFAEENGDFFLSQLNLDEGARVLGEFAIGTNMFIQDITGSTLFDEKIGGTIHMALGFSIPESKGTNVSSIHWDIVHNMRNGGEIYVDGTLFYRSGEFMI